jgi:hypothetical protein
MDHFRDPDGAPAGGVAMPGTTPQPDYDPDEPWSGLPPLRKVSPAAAFDLIEALRAAGIPVLGPKARRAGLFSGGKVDVTLSVPERLRSQATLIVASHFPEG